MTYAFSQMSGQSGSYALPWLIELSSDSGLMMQRLVNNNSDISYGGNTYTASSFEYTPAPSVSGFDGGGSLSITVVDNQVIDIVETYRRVKLTVVGVLVQGGTIYPVSNYVHLWGSVSWNRGKATFNFEKDDRLSMTFPGDVFSHYNNRGN